MSSGAETATDPGTVHLPALPWAHRVFSFPVTLVAALLATLFLLAANQGNGHFALTDPDIWWHMANARALLSTHHFIRQDLFSYTVAGKPWINFEWLAELPFYYAYKEFGARGVFVLMMTLFESITLGTFLLAWFRSRDVKAAFLASWVTAMLATVSLGPRTLLFGWLLLVVMLGVMELYRADRDYTWAVPVLFCVWINTHGSWFIGFVLWLVWVGAGFVSGQRGAVESVDWTTTQRRKLLLVTAVSFGLLFLNPYGWRLLAYPLDLMLKQVNDLRLIEEWATLDFHSLRGRIVLATLLGMGVLNLVRRRAWPLSELLFAAIAVYGALSYSRFAFLAGILLAPMLAVDLRGALSPYRAEVDGIGRNVIALGGLLALVFWFMPSAGAMQAEMVAQLPQATLQRVAELPAGTRVFNNFDWGGYLMWTEPQRRVFIDSRVDIFVHEGVLNEYALATSAVNTEEILDKYRINYALLPKVSSMTYLLAHMPGWQMDTTDANAVLFRRTGTLL